MSFLEEILRADRTPRGGSTAYRGPRSVGDGIEAADVAFYGPMVFNRPAPSWPEGS
ncbi:hypothetical protein [Cellulomonas sp. PhB143]|uniref:hypothetical protein n=1 Tax=Cellulomonas sp. PhB143 TaxID=2485186 RepID=UPI000F93510D|nr:hypothetical protein [Cellulomonas sp. PhB143]ROS75496.1 hypothetical protein EDF32_1906 [Cellulomonas sp. PhB143]